jgi:putative redox protein
MDAKVTWAGPYEAADEFVGTATSGHAMVLDAGEKKAAVSPLESVLIGLCGCTAADVVSILRKKREPVTTLEVKAHARRADTHPMVFTEIKLTYRVGGKVSRKGVEDAVHLSKTKYCSVSAMLGKTAKMETAIELLDEA